MWEVILLHRDYQTLFKLNLLLCDIYGDIEEVGKIHYLNLGELTDEQINTVKLAINKLEDIPGFNGITMKKVHLVLEDGTTFYDYLKEQSGL